MKTACSGAISAASGWSIRLTRNRRRASSRTLSRKRCSQACSACRSNICAKVFSSWAAPALAAGAAGAGAALRGVVFMALAIGRSSTSRLNSSSLISRTGTSVRLAARTRSRSLAIARCRGFRRGWAARDRRRSADFSAATMGSTLPVSCACCWASRSPDSMSTTRFSSRERDRLCISSSSCVRCRLTSLMRVSWIASRAASSRVLSWAALARVRASIAWAPESVLRRASSSWILPSFCHNSPVANKPATTSAASSTAHLTEICNMPGAAAGAGTLSGAGKVAGRGGTVGLSLMNNLILSSAGCPGCPSRPDVTPQQHPNRRPARFRRCADA
ncbi:hypothetical protein D9M73_116430 [compost metagenome]